MELIVGDEDEYQIFSNALCDGVNRHFYKNTLASIRNTEKMSPTNLTSRTNKTLKTIGNVLSDDHQNVVYFNFIQNQMKKKTYFAYLSIPQTF